MSKSSTLVNGKASKVQDDANMKALRELCQVPCNRHCFDCAQRGPTYVNTTIGSFICMTCSGLLRGLTPPHRVKSISMASFTPEEIELLKSRGNEYCRKVWLATHTSRDSHLGLELEPDRRNALKSHMSAKYEQKRYYVDPSKLPQSELTEIQAQTTRALSTSSSISKSNSSIQKSPSLSSASSGSSLSLQQQNLHNNQNPSPVMNNLRNAQIQQQSNRLVNSVTLPDIKPLTSLLGSVPSNNGLGFGGNQNGKNLNPINFINNLSNLQDEKIINTNTNQGNNSSMKITDPWGSPLSDPTSNGFNSNTNFANFDEAFSAGINSNGNFASDLFNSSTAKLNSSSNNFANFDSLPQQKPLLPSTNSNGHHTTSDAFANFAPINGNESVNVSSNGNAGGGGTSAQDRYAALKDLDDMFKHVETPSGGNGVSNGMATSASVPANLSSSSGGANGWYSTSPNNQPNPFSQVGSSPPSQQQTNGWGSSSSTTNGTSSSGPNPHNPFFSSSSWQSSNKNGAIGNNSSSSSSNVFAPSQSMNFNHQTSNPMSSSGGNGFTMSNSNNSPGGQNLFSPSGGHNSGAHFQNFINNSPTEKIKAVFNPFNFNGTSGPSTVNPHNPFL